MDSSGHSALSSSLPVLQASGLRREYTFHQQAPGFFSAVRGLFHRETQTRVAVDGIDLSIRAGEVVGLLGPNGAGKTTTLKMLTGLLHPTAGELQVLGFKPFDRNVEYLRRIALVMGQKSLLWWDVPAMETYNLQKEMYAIPPERFKIRLAELAQMLEVEHLLGVQVRKTSLGERMKLELIAALIHEPDIVFLDEPTIGLDVVAKARVRSFLAEVNREHGTTILITSHDMDDIEALCKRVILIDHGSLAYDGDLAALVRDVQPRKLVKATYTGPADRAMLQTAHPGVQLNETEDAAILDLEVRREDLTDVLATIPRLGTLADLQIMDAQVEDIIRTLFSRRKAVTP